MELWTEYEGRTIDGAFPLNKLIQPEGRSAFFSTSNRKGEPTVIRLVASHFDEEEILSRWRGVEALRHPNILKLEKFGQLILDDTTVVYAVLEPVDANLADVIAGQRLSLDDTRQLAISLVSALELLHANGFIHEHIEPANIFAVGEIVKLRGDCIRETPEGETGLELKQRDVHDLAVVLLQALAQTRSLEAATHEQPLPGPFAAIIENSLKGTWGLSQVSAALQNHKAPDAPVPQPKPVAPAKAATPPKGLDPATQATETPSSRPPLRRLGEPVLTNGTSNSGSSFRPNSAPQTRPTRWIAAAALVVLTLALAGWYVSHQRSENAETSQAVLTPEPKPTPTPVSAPEPAATGSTAKTISPDPADASASSRSKDAASTGAHAQWRVVAFTYNHQDQAAKKVQALAAKHPGLSPQIFSPSGHSPYLVTVGGAMSREQALTFAQKARSEGLPRDTYAQNYKQ
jgi:hypothetical protein